ncbi:MAG: hypothetical protein AAF281_17240 [Pseudomonadota bacterium]
MHRKTLVSMSIAGALAAMPAAQGAAKNVDAGGGARFDTVTAFGDADAGTAIHALLANPQTTLLENSDAVAPGETVAVFGAVAGASTGFGRKTGPVLFALTAKLRDGQAVLWHGYDDSFATGQADHGR